MSLVRPNKAKEDIQQAFEQMWKEMHRLREKHPQVSFDLMRLFRGSLYNYNKKFRLWLLVMLIALPMSLVSLVPVAWAATTRSINVTNIDDNNPGGGCTLREAIDLANANAVAGPAANGCVVGESGVGSPIIYQINLPPAYFYTLAGAAGEDNNASGDLDIAANVNITGASANSSFIQAGATTATGIERVFHITVGGITVNISGVTIRNGRLTGAADGAGIYNANNAVVNISNSTITGNEVTGSGEDGGGIANVAGGIVNITNSTVSNNRTTGGGGSQGGGVFNLSSVSKINLTNSTLSNNSSAAFGGGIYNGGILTVNGSTISGNTATNDGGGIFNDSNGNATINSSIITDNRVNGSGEDGGGLANSGGTVNISDSAITHNQVTGGGGSQGGGIFNLNAGSTMSITRTTISNNSTPAFGGGIYNGELLNISNSTISTNMAASGGGAMADDFTATFNITHTTIYNNFSTSGGGGIDLVNGTVNVAKTILAGNNNGSGSNNVFIVGSGTVNSLGYNLESGTEAGFTATGDLQNTNPAVSPLSNNGGVGQTHALLASSPARNAVPLAQCNLAIDQRGVSRPQGTACDIGSYEREGVVHLPLIRK